MFQFSKNLYLSQVARKITYASKVTNESIYTIEVYNVLPCHWLLVHHGSGFHGSKVRSGLRGSGDCGSPCAN